VEKRLVNQPLLNERAFIGRPAVLVAAAIVVGRSAVHPRGLLAGRSLLNGAGVHFGRQSDGSGSDDEGGDEGLGKHVSVLGAWAAEVRYQAACRRNIPQGATIEREAVHTQVIILWLRRCRKKRPGRRRSIEFERRMSIIAQGLIWEAGS